LIWPYRQTSPSPTEISADSEMPYELTKLVNSAPRSYVATFLSPTPLVYSSYAEAKERQRRGIGGVKEADWKAKEDKVLEIFCSRVVALM